MAVTTASQQYTAELCTACAVCVCMVDFHKLSSTLLPFRRVHQCDYCVL